jgi:DnaJ family protein C protein 19
MILAILLAAALGWWLHKEGALLPNLKRLAILGGGGILIARLLETGQVLFAGVAAALAPGALAEARAVLGVAPTDDAAAINAAWRRVIAQVHPDKGGTADLARRVTAARDLLLARR